MKTGKAVKAINRTKDIPPHTGCNMSFTHSPYFTPMTVVKPHYFSPVRDLSETLPVVAITSSVTIGSSSTVKTTEKIKSVHSPGKGKSPRQT